MRLKESSHTEFKETWKDDCLKTVCAFANTGGGKVYVGVNDQGNAIGIQNGKKLIEDIPNKIASKLGLFASVDTQKIDNKEVAVIEVGRYKVPISYRGKFYIRSGSTTQELNDKELQRFLLAKSGLSWDDQTEERAFLKDLNPETISHFRKLARDKFPAIAAEDDDRTLLGKLRLLDNDKPKRAAILLFGKDPQKFYISAHFKIGKFAGGTDLISQDQVEGNLFEQLNMVMEILRNKYLQSEIYYEGIHRKARLEYPEIALREAIINALIHKDYTGAHIQLKLYPDQLILWNEGKLPEDISINSLKRSHPSRPRNELIAGVFYKAGLIEAWGQGTINIINSCKEAGLPDPNYREAFGGFELNLVKNIYTEEYLNKLGLNERQVKALEYIKQYGKITNTMYQELCHTSRRTAVRELNKMLEKKLVVKSGIGKGTNYTITQ